MSHKLNTIATCIALFLPAVAQAEGPYVGVEGGLFVPQSLDYNFVGLQNFFSSSYAKGIEGGAKLGYDFEGIRVEAEISYKRASADRFGFKLQGQPLAMVRGDDVSGHISSLSGMVNGYWDITHGRIQPYVGAGIGFARIDSHNVGYAGYGDSGVFLDATDTAMAFQLMAGARMRVTPHLSASIGYRYFDVEKVKLNIFNSSARSNLRASSVLVGLTYNFGVPTALTPPPPRPPVLVSEDVAAGLGPVEPAAPPADADVAVEETSFVLNFGKGSAALGAPGKAKLDQAANAYRRSGRASVMIGSNANSAGPAPYSDALARRRAAVVRQYLVGRHVPAGDIQIQDFANASPRSGSGDRIVEISFGIGSGQ